MKYLLIVTHPQTKATKTFEKTHKATVDFLKESYEELGWEVELREWDETKTTVE